MRPLVYNSGLDKTLLPHTPYLFEYTDPVAGTGYIHTVYTLFTGDETLLTRAEAYIMQKDYPNALKDMNLFLSNACKSYTPLTEETVTAWAAGTEYYRPETDQNQSDMNKKGPTPKKELHPAFDLDETQEAMVHTLLMLRRYETLHCGLRWFDNQAFWRSKFYRRTLDSHRRTCQRRDRQARSAGQPSGHPATERRNHERSARQSEVIRHLRLKNAYYEKNDICTVRTGIRTFEHGVFGGRTRRQERNHGYRL